MNMRLTVKRAFQYSWLMLALRYYFFKQGSQTSDDDMHTDNQVRTLHLKKYINLSCQMNCPL